MHKLVSMTLASLLLSVAFSGTARASSFQAKELGLGADVAMLVPVGEWADMAGMGLGVLGRIDLRASGALALTAQPGFFLHFPKKVSIPFLGEISSNTTELLLLFGARYFVDDVWLTAQTGINLWRMESAGFSNDHTRIPLLIGAGYSLGSLQLSGNLLIPNFAGRRDGESLASGFSFALGYLL